MLQIYARVSDSVAVQKHLSVFRVTHININEDRFIDNDASTTLHVSFFYVRLKGYTGRGVIH